LPSETPNSPESSERAIGLAPLSNFRDSHVVLGTWFGTGAAVFYTCASICLKAVAHCDPAWVSCVKAMPTMVLAGIVVWSTRRAGAVALPSPALLGALVASGLFVQLGGNVANQWSLTVVGLAMCVPLTFGALIVFGAALGRAWLGERVAPRSAVAIVLLLAAIPILHSGADDAHRSVAAAPAGEVPPWLLTLGVGAACLSGVAYATQAAVIRRVVRGVVPLPLTLLIFSTTGVVCLGVVSLVQAGFDGLLATDPRDLAVMVGAGGFNAVGFFCLSKSLQYASIVRVNALNASQTALAALAGVGLFGEPLTAALLAGVVLTVLGLLLTQRSA
jgi:drug/metabolite transporter (DMT)-like permease